jgi:hypothetical protein
MEKKQQISSSVIGQEGYQKITNLMLISKMPIHAL